MGVWDDVFGKMYICVGECGLVCVVDGVWCMLW